MILFLFLSNPFLDSLTYHYNLYRPDSLVTIAKCSIVPDIEFRVSYSKGDGLEVKEFSKDERIEVELEPFARDLIRGTLLLAGLGLSELWESFGGVNFVDTVIAKNDWFTIIPKDSFLFARADLNVENWLIKEAKILAHDRDMSAKIDYKSELPVNINIRSNSSKFTIRYDYGKESKDYHNLRTPSKTEVISEYPDIPDKLKHVIITYSPTYVYVKAPKKK